MDRFGFLTDERSIWGRWLPRLFVIFWALFAFDKADIITKLDQRPVGEHLWAQLDRGSSALCYYMDDAPFLLPRCHQTSSDNEGITAGEFPLIPYTVSKLYALFGFNEKYHRLLVFGLTLLGLVFGFGVMRQLIGSAWWAAVVTSLWFASPNLILYSISFLPDGPAMAFSLAAIYFLIRTESGRWHHVFAYGFFLALAGLLKLTAVAVIIPVVVAYLFKTLDRVSIISRLKKVAIPTVVAMVVIASWVFYARWLNEQHHTFTFLLHALPPRSIDELMQGMATLNALKEWYYIIGLWWFLAAATLRQLVFIRRSDRLLGFATLGLYISFAFMFLLLFEKAPTHMYYWVPFQVVILFHAAWLFKTFGQNAPKWMAVIGFVGSVVLINYDSIHIYRNVKARWTHSPKFYARYYDLEAKLDELHVSYEARVFSYEDESFNNSLYFMNRKGSVAHRKFPTETITRLLERSTHAILNDTTLLDHPEHKHYFYKQIGTHNDLFIYELNADKRTDR